tara:strand:- start:54538 stop:55614 length:1077 start_codon:yes stop_codon:yes gene_type:complete
MAIDIRGLGYVPTIFIRNAEIKALSNLPVSDKRDLYPIFQLRPWLNSHHLENSIKVVEKAIGEKPYFLDLDPYYDFMAKDLTKEAVAEFRSLFSPKDAFSNWYSFVEKFDRVTPCLRLESGGYSTLGPQIEVATSLDRGFLAYIRHDFVYPFDQVITQVCETGHSNFAFVIDTGWNKNLMPRMQWASSLIAKISDHRPEIPVIVTGSSFPDLFVNFSQGFVKPIDERAIYNSLVREHNAASLIYGDWGSTRPPSSGGGGQKIPPRIDLPTSSGWAIFRSEDDDEGYQEMAVEAMGSDEWNGQPQLWGTHMIESTSLGSQSGIKSVASASATRINIHLHTQLRYSAPGLFFDTEDDYVD